jgi:hypothetical protein
MGKVEGKRLLGYTVQRREDNMKICLGKGVRAWTGFAWLRMERLKSSFLRFD